MIRNLINNVLKSVCLFFNTHTIVQKSFFIIFLSKMKILFILIVVVEVDKDPLMLQLLIN